MSYKSTVNTIRDAALQALDGTGRFDHGRHVDISQKFDGDYPFINLYPFEMVTSSGGEFINSNNLIVGFWMQDRPDTSTLEREDIIEQMDVLCTIFMNILENEDRLRISNVRREPQYQSYPGTLSGFAVQFTLQNFDPC